MAGLPRVIASVSLGACNASRAAFRQALRLPRRGGSLFPPGRVPGLEAPCGAHQQLRPAYCGVRFASLSRAGGTKADTACDDVSRLPVGIFIDLYNVLPDWHGRADAKEFARPLKVFADAVGSLKEFRAFGHSESMSSDREGMEWWFEMGWEEDVGGIEAEWDREASHSGWDEDQDLRCGVCGARMKLNKKDIASGRTELDKLERHMRQLHDREERKRGAKAKRSKKGRTAKEKEKSRKYRAAQMDARLSSTWKAPRNPLFDELREQLREQGIICRHSYDSDDVDNDLMWSVHRWMSGLPKPSLGEPEGEPRGCLVVVSKGVQFEGLLHDAKKWGLLTVSACLDTEWLTWKPCDTSDIVMHEDSVGLGNCAMPKSSGPEGVSVWLTSNIRATAVTEAGRKLLDSCVGLAAARGDGNVRDSDGGFGSRSEVLSDP